MPFGDPTHDPSCGVIGWCPTRSMIGLCQASRAMKANGNERKRTLVSLQILYRTVLTLQIRPDTRRQ
ncbi:hypothetical protein L873DRAFT_465621 [Choiromyces venosus 120613-1]|uniref:Uncharacterized protein n=1 Tax=Choiromyces venosus 120613-1 TaxID=1336337 RepID=A0A3N4JVS1_9PEZI|nr:hypothetical protein L873DRAFT_465621 [Choiromyces venosus 120613-1]